MEHPKEYYGQSLYNLGAGLQAVRLQGMIRQGWGHKLALKECLLVQTEVPLTLAANPSVFIPEQVAMRVTHYRQRSFFGRLWQRVSSFVSGYPISDQERLYDYWECYQRYRRVYEWIAPKLSEAERSGFKKELPMQPFYARIDKQFKQHFELSGKLEREVKREQIEERLQQKLAEQYSEHRLALRKVYEEQPEQGDQMFTILKSVREQDWERNVAELYRKYGLGRHRRLEDLNGLRARCYVPQEEAFTKEWQQQLSLVRLQNAKREGERQIAEARQQLGEESSFPKREALNAYKEKVLQCFQTMLVAFGHHIEGLETIDQKLLAAEKERMTQELQGLWRKASRVVHPDKRSGQEMDKETAEAYEETYLFLTEQRDQHLAKLDDVLQSSIAARTFSSSRGRVTANHNHAIAVLKEEINHLAAEIERGNIDLQQVKSEMERKFAERDDKAERRMKVAEDKVERRMKVAEDKVEQRMKVAEDKVEQRMKVAEDKVEQRMKVAEAKISKLWKEAKEAEERAQEKGRKLEGEIARLWDYLGVKQQAPKESQENMESSEPQKKNWAERSEDQPSKDREGSRGR